jgi:predicted nucleic acid-binding Zn ribbon protein
MSNTDGWYSEGPVPKEPERLGDVLGEVARGLGLPDPKAIESIARAWPTLVGEAISTHSRPRSLRDGVLTVAVDSPVWGTQLRPTRRYTRLGDVVAGRCRRASVTHSCAARRAAERRRGSTRVSPPSGTLLAVAIRALIRTFTENRS